MPSKYFRRVKGLYCKCNAPLFIDRKVKKKRFEKGQHLICPDVDCDKMNFIKITKKGKIRAHTMGDHYEQGE